MSTEPNIGVKRIYDPRLPADGRRILVDRIWPRGLTKDTIIVARWDPQKDRWIALSRPGGYPLHR